MMIKRRAENFSWKNCKNISSNRQLPVWSWIQNHTGMKANERDYSSVKSVLDLAPAAEIQLVNSTADVGWVDHNIRNYPLFRGRLHNSYFFVEDILKQNMSSRALLRSLLNQYPCGPVTEPWFPGTLANTLPTRFVKYTISIFVISPHLIEFLLF